MRGLAVAMCGAGLALIGAAPAAAHPGHGPTVVTVGGLAFSPSSVVVLAGDTVIWDWAGPDTDHSVSAEPGQAEAFDSDPGRSAAEIRHPRGHVFPHLFRQAGTYRYVCRVHPTMRGEIVVRAGGPPRDGTPPAFTGLRVIGTVAHARLTEDADVGATIRAWGRRRTLRTFGRAGFTGTNRYRLPVRGLAAGRYILRLTAVDDAGNRGASSVAFRVPAR
jgi:plastocyanin